MIKPYPLRIISTLLFLALASLGLAQNNAQVRLLGIHSNGQTLLRWAPADYFTWQRGITAGYRLERYTIATAGTPFSPSQITASKVVLATALKPQSASVFEQMADTSSAAGVAAAALYEDSLEISLSTNDPFIQALSTTEQNDTRFGLGLVSADASFGVAQAMALGWRDAAVESNSVYEYVIRLASADTNLTTGAVRLVIDTRQNLNLPTMPTPNLEVGVNQVLLTWSKIGLESFYTRYDIERSSDNGNSWLRRNRDPILPTESDNAPNPTTIFYLDSLEDATITYLYRIRGHSIFGVSTAGVASGAQSKPLPLGQTPNLTEVLPFDGSKLKLSWSFPSQANAQLKGFKIYRSPLIDGPFAAISGLENPNTREFVDPNPWSANYYQVRAIDQADQEWPSLTLLGQPTDTVAPVAVSGLQGQIDASGVASLRWAPNPDGDIRGYRVWQADAENGTYIQISGTLIEATVFTIPVELKTSTEEVFFKVDAVDYRGNAGEPSAPLVLQRPDLIPPAPPLLEMLEPVASNIRIKWSPSVSTDVVGHEVQRQATVETGWIKLLIHLDKTILDQKENNVK